MREAKRKFKPGLVLGAALFLSAPSAFASGDGGQVSPAQTAMTPWNDPSYQECGHECLYNKANENLSLQAIYLVRKLSVVKKGSESDGRAVAGTFCLQSESWDACKSRYLTTQLIALQKIRAALVKNSDSSAQLLSDNPTVAGAKKSNIPLLGTDDGTPKKPLTPYVVSIDDVKKNYAEETQKLKYLASTDAQEWDQSLIAEPSEDDYIKFRAVPKDPANPGAGMIYVPETDPLTGALKKDTAAFNAAKKNYELLSPLKRTKVDLRKMYDAAKKTPRGKFEDEVSQENQAIFFESRKIIVDEANKGLGAGGTQAGTVNSGATTAASVASGAKAKTKSGTSSATIQSVQAVNFQGGARSNGRAPTAVPSAPANPYTNLTGREAVITPDAQSGQSSFQTVVLSPQALDKAIADLMK